VYWLSHWECYYLLLYPCWVLLVSSTLVVPSVFLVVAAFSVFVIWCAVACYVTRRPCLYARVSSFSFSWWTAITPSYLLVTQLLHKESLKYYITSKCVISFCMPFADRGFSSTSDNTILYKNIVISSSIKINITSHLVRGTTLYLTQKFRSTLSRVAALGLCVMRQLASCVVNWI
jgi:hypothetical protein